MRTTDVVGVQVSFWLEIAPIHTAEAVRASMGAVFNVKMIACSEIEFISFTAAWPGRVIAQRCQPPWIIDKLIMMGH